MPHSKPRHPEVSVKLTETDGNAFSILSKVRRAMRRQMEPGTWREAYAEYQEEATSGDYDNLLVTTQRYVNVE